MRDAVAILLALSVLVVGCSKGGPSPKSIDSIQRITEQVEQERQSSAAAVEAYVPKVKGSINEPSSPAAEILRHLPGVAGVEVLVAAPNPTHCIIHLRDWHFVPKELFALEARHSAGRPLSDEEVNSLYEQNLLDVELVQIEQEAILRCLVRHHELRSVLVEGLTPHGLTKYREIIASFRDMNEQLTDLQVRRAKLKREATAIDREIEVLVRGHRRRVLEHGAVAQLAIAREIEVLPLDEDEVLEQARPDGKARLDPAKLEARHDAQVRAALASGPCRFIILGGSHDLSASIGRLGRGTAEYIRVTTRRYKEFD
jgi:hypothetical protein